MATKKKAKSKKSKAKRVRKTPKLTPAQLRAYEKEKRALLNKHYAMARK